MIKLDGLTETQYAICEILWGLDSFDDIVNWVDEQDEFDRREALLMMELMTLASLDDEPCTDLSMAVSIIDKIKNQL